MGPKFLRPLTAPDAEKGRAVHFGSEQALALDCGRTLAPWTHHEPLGPAMPAGKARLLRLATPHVNEALVPL